MIYKAYKKIGENMLQAMQRFADENKLDLHKPTFTGRLDPLAKGIFLILTESDKKKKEYINSLDKKYKFYILFGISTDSGDLLGFVSNYKFDATVEEERLVKVIESLNGTEVDWEYPCFSSKKVNGKALFEWYLENECEGIEVPRYKSFIHTLEFKSMLTFSKQELKQLVFERLKFLQNADIDFAYNDYRKVEIMQKWSTFFNNFASEKYHVAELELVAGKSLYVRTLAEKIGKELNCPTTAFDIERLAFGRYVKFVQKGFFWKKY